MSITQEGPRGLDDVNFWRDGVSAEYFRKSYLGAAQITVVVALILSGLDQTSAALGLLSGAAVALFSTWTTEVMVRLLFRGGSFSGAKLVIGAIVKMPFLVSGLVGVAWAAYNGHLNAFGVVGGVLLVHGVMLFVMLGAAAAGAAKSEQRYR